MATTKRKKRRPVGRPTEFKSKYIKETIKLSTLGVTEEKIAWYFGVHPNTFRGWKTRYPDLADAIAEGKAKRDVALLTAMFANATQRHNPAVQIFLAKNWLGMTDRQDLRLPDFTDDGDKALKIKVVHVNGSRPEPNNKTPQDAVVSTGKKGKEKK